MADDFNATIHFRSEGGGDGYDESLAQYGIGPDDVPNKPKPPAAVTDELAAANRLLTETAKKHETVARVAKQKAEESERIYIGFWDAFQSEFRKTWGLADKASLRPGGVTAAQGAMNMAPTSVTSSSANAPIAPAQAPQSMPYLTTVQTQTAANAASPAATNSARARAGLAFGRSINPTMIASALTGAIAGVMTQAIVGAILKGFTIASEGFKAPEWSMATQAANARARMEESRLKSMQAAHYDSTNTGGMLTDATSYFWRDMLAIGYMLYELLEPALAVIVYMLSIITTAVRVILAFLDAAIWLLQFAVVIIVAAVRDMMGFGGYVQDAIEWVKKRWPFGKQERPKTQLDRLLEAPLGDEDF